MPTATHSLTILERPARIWAYLMDETLLGRFSTYKSVIRSAIMTSRRVSGEGKDARFGLFHEDVKVQEFAVDVFDPPHCYAMSSVWSQGPAMTPKSSVTFTITPVSDFETKVDISMDMNFPIFPLGWILNLLPLQRGLDGILLRIAQDMPAALSQPQPPRQI